MTSLTVFDPQIPRSGEGVASKVLRDLLKAVATGHAGSQTPAIPAQIVSDVRFARIDMSTKYNVHLTINGVAQTVNLRSQAVSITAVTPTEAVSAINSAFSSIGTVAFVYDAQAYDSSAYILLRTPTAGTTATITLNNGSSADALDMIFGVASRGLAVPYTVTGATTLEGTPWYNTGASKYDYLLYSNTPATATSEVDLTNPVDLSIVRYLRIKITTPLGTFGPLNIDCQGATAVATTVTEIRDKINAAFVANSPWFAAYSVGPARVVQKNGAGNYLEVVSGANTAPDKGSACRVLFSELVSGAYQLDDAVKQIFGFSRGEGGRYADRLPITFYGEGWTRAFLRGVNDRSGAGVGPWGLTLEERLYLPTTGVVDGEIRMSKTEGALWVYREGKAPGWRRAAPGWEYPVSFDRGLDRYRLVTVGDDYVPVPLASTGKHITAGREGDVVTLVDARDPAWPNTTYPKHASEASNARNLFGPYPRFDNFAIQDLTKLAPSTEGVKWTQSATKFVTIGSNTSVYVGGAGAGVEDRCVYRRAAGHQTTFAANGLQSQFDFTTDALKLQPIGTGIRVGSIYVSVGNGTLTWADGLDNRATPVAQIIGTNINQALSTVDLTTGKGSITFSTPPPAGYTVYIAWSVLSDLIVSAEVGVDSWVQSGNIPEFGLIYGAKNQGDGTINTDFGFLCVIRGNGVGEIRERTGTGSAVVRSTFTVDPPLRGVFSTLRVEYDGVRNHKVFWGGSNARHNWVQKESVATPAGKVANEVDPVLNPLIHTFDDGGGSVNAGNTYCGMVGTAVNTSGGFPAKSLLVQNFQAHGGWSFGALSSLPGLPPVSGARLRDAIVAIQAYQQSGLITDCTPQTPLVFEAKNDLVLGIDISARKLTFDLDHANVKHFWSSPATTRGVQAIWSLVVDVTNLAGNGFSSAQDDPVGFNVAWPSLTTYQTTTLPSAAGWSITWSVTASKVLFRNGPPATGSGLAVMYRCPNGVSTNPNGAVLDLRVFFLNGYYHKITELTIVGIAMKL
mgnify:CR=1 FL=1